MAPLKWRIVTRRTQALPVARALSTYGPKCMPICRQAEDFLFGKTIEEAWATCTNPMWMCWILVDIHVGIPNKWVLWRENIHIISAKERCLHWKTNITPLTLVRAINKEFKERQSQKKEEGRQES